ncbi:MAG TPA: serine/threonine-protein kinase, partial [Terriglobales bacterium]|nr:serine/threonine-protein kinase [Terriglobales bacterium]
MQALLSHYRILEQIGAGGMGVVYRAHDEHLDCDVALKVLPPGKLADEAARKRFRKEALALSKVNHPNIAVVHDFDTQNGTDFLVEELIPGLSLSEMLVSGPLPERDIVNLGSQLAEGLQAAHQQGIIHRDLKPANIRVTPDVRLKILDFGLARVVRPSSPTALTASETQAPSFAGTLPYMAPEQLLAERVDPRTDIWAVGCVLYEMATSRPPFLGYGPALIDAILHQPAPAASKLNSKVSPGLEAIILKCLDKNAENRYQSAKELAVDLRRLQTG